VLRKDAKIGLLRRVPLFSRCSKRELGAIATLTTMIDVPAGDELVTEGERGRDFMVLVEGAAKATREGRTVRAMGPGDFFGEIALVLERPRTATVTTTSPSRLLVLTPQAFWSLVAEMPTIERRVLETLAERLPAPL
jgi:CRP/FNR family transcriptional regulator, cyclic AMP receptor protein